MKRVFTAFIKAILLLIIIVFAGQPARAQQSMQSKKRLSISKTDLPILLDGKLDDDAWRSAEVAGNFQQFFPFDTSLAVGQTQVMMLFDDTYLYVGGILFDTIPGPYVSESLRRDFRGGNIDGFTLVMDPFMDGQNGVFFGVNPFNVQREGLIFNGGTLTEDFDLSWDNIWYSATHIEAGKYWSFEMMIPFKTLRFSGEARTWGVNFYRIDSKYNERSVWSRIPRQFQLFALAFNGILEWNQSPGNPGSNISVIPFVATRNARNHLEGTDAESSLAVGGDVKIAITPSLNLDLTVNPDFSQVEVDVQQTNIDRFEIFFPERRQFFLENADLFANFGFDNARPFFSRRIGVAIDSATGQNVENRITAGARLSGKLDENWRLGMMHMQTETNPTVNVNGSFFTVAAVQRKVGNRSNIASMIVDQQAKAGAPVDAFRPQDGTYSRLAGFEYNLASFDGKWTGKTYYQHTFDQGEKGRNFAHGTTLSYNTLNFFASWTHQIIGDGFRAKVGFVPRTDFNRANPVIGYNIFPQSKLINRHQFSLSNNWLWNEEWGVTDYNFGLNYQADLQNTGQFNFSLLSNYVKLFFPFNPTGNPNQQFQPGDDFVQTGFLTSFQTDRRRPLSARTQIISGGFFNGNLRQLSGSINYRYLQYATFAMAYTINRINLTDGFDSRTLVLIGPRFDITFNNNLFWTTFIQYNNQFDNININSRLQWRFRPVSDLFIVYTDNYFPDTFTVKNRALVAKFTYWLNL